MQFMKIFILTMTAFFFLNFRLYAEVLFTAEKNGFNAYKIENASVQKSIWNTNADIISFSGTKNGIAIALKDNSNAKHYHYESVQKDFFVLSKIIIPQNAEIQKIIFSYDANYVAVVSQHQQDTKLVVYRKDETAPYLDQTIDNSNGGGYFSGASFSQDGKTIIIWHQKIQKKEYSITAYNLKSGKIDLKTTLSVSMGYSGLWPLNVRCISACEGIFVGNIDKDIQKQYRKINSDGSVDNITKEDFFEQFEDFFATNKGVFKFSDHKIVAVINYEDYFEDNVVIKSIVSPDKKLVALATTKGYYVIDLATKKRISIAPKIFNDFFCWGKYIELDELSNALKEWKADYNKQSDKNKFSSRTNFHTEKFYNIISKGSIISAPLVSEFKKGNEEVIVFFPKLLKVVFESSFDSNDKKWVFDDYPDYVYYPPGFHADENNNKINSIWIYWWDKGRKLTPKIFKRKYEAYTAARKSGKEDATRETYIKLQNMGIIILPNLLAKVESNESDLIPIFNYLSNQNNLKDAIDCKKWWESNKGEYQDILDY
ncbi:MAG: hypothetical protein PHS31_05460 [Victivallaceae bacterium]|nr:hypothetical protein [Victivallaceae bacterium]